MKALSEVPISAQIPQQPPSMSFAEVGLAGAVLLVVVQNGMHWFRRKEEGETALMRSLVERLQNNESHLLERLIQIHERNYQALMDLKEAILKSNEDIHRSYEKTQQQFAHLVSQLKELASQVKLLQQQIRKD